MSRTRLWANMDKSKENPKGIWKLPDDLSGIVSLLTSILAAITGLVSIFYAFGYIIVNQRLLSLGVRDFALGNPAYLSAGISFTVIHVICVVIPLLISRARKDYLYTGPTLSFLFILVILQQISS